MDIVVVKGGLGNQMFQYAFMESLRHKGRDAHISLKYYMVNDVRNRVFALDKAFPNFSTDSIDETNQENLFLWSERDDSIFDENVYCREGCCYDGYWQSEKYFIEISDKIKEIFTFGEGEAELQNIYKYIEQNVFASIHVRRGDYLKHPEIYTGMCTEEYYKRAMNCIREKRGNVQFLCFADDIEFVSNSNLFSECLMINKDDFNNYQDWYDMKLMTACKDNIIANSTFSWWGAWLNTNNDKTVIAPYMWLANKSTPDICPDSWMRIQV